MAKKIRKNFKKELHECEGKEEEGKEEERNEEEEIAVEEEHEV